MAERRESPLAKIKQLLPKLTRAERRDVLMAIGNLEVQDELEGQASELARAAIARARER